MIERPVHALLDAILGGLELIRLAAATRFRLRGRYWRWRAATAFGGGRPASKRTVIRRTLAYGRWARSIRRLGR